MRRSLTIATTVAAAGALLATIPVSAATKATCDGSGPRAGAGQQAGQGQHRGPGPGQNAGRGMMNVPSGVLTDAQKASLAYMAQEEKLAHDVYTVLGTKYPKTVIFKRISASEQRHWDVIGVLLDRYGIADPTDDLAVGEFAAPDLQTMFDELVLSASTRKAALKVGVAIEQDDIDELEKASVGLAAPDVSRVYSNLTRASEQHLAAFESRL